MTLSSEVGTRGSPWSTAAIVQVLRDRFGLDPVSVTALGGELDQNSVAICADGTRVVVKIATADADVTKIRWHHSLLAALQNAPQGLPVPCVVPTVTGSDLAMVDSHGEDRAVRVYTWLPGITLAELDRHSPELLYELGQTAGHLVAALPQEIPAELEATTHHWDVLRSPAAIAAGLGAVSDPHHLQCVKRIVRWFGEIVAPMADRLPRHVIHQDLNDFNVLAQPDGDGRHHVSGVLDFFDALHTARVGEVAVAVAYAMLRKADPLVAASHVIRGFHDVVPLSEDELGVIYPMAAARLCVNAVTWTSRHAGDGRPYGATRMRHTWPTIAKLSQIPPELAEARFRHSIGDSDETAASSVQKMLARADSSLSRVFNNRPADVDLSVESAMPDVDMPSGSTWAGRHLTSRQGTALRRTTEAGEPATIHLGVDIYCRTPDAVCAPMPGTVEGGADTDGTDNTDARTGLLLRHQLPAGPAFWSRWTGLINNLAPGRSVTSGERLGTIEHTSPDGTPGLRVCLFTSAEAARLAPDGFITPTSVPAWAAISPDPSTFLGLTRPAEEHQGWDVEQVTRIRERHFGRSQRSYYRQPMRLVRGEGVWLYDENGRGYLDAINNVSHVGHANRSVNQAAIHQMRRLNTNSRFVYDGISRYASRLVSLLPDPLEVVFLVCSGSEANDLALRMARQVTGREDVIVIDGAYHGNTSAVTGISPNRYKGSGGHGAPPTTHEVLQPNLYRGHYRYGDPDAGVKYAAGVAAVAERLTSMGRSPAAFIAESLMGTAGNIVFPDNYLSHAFDAVRAVGGLCISDEVQVGFGRLGETFWGFERQGVVPDIVTMGKPMGNGHPMAAVVTTREIADAFDTGMKYFNTFGGNPVSCAIGMAVLDEIENSGLQAHARSVGAYFMNTLADLRDKHPLIGDVRGQGLYLGIELVRDRKTREPAPDSAYYISERMKDEGIIIYPTGALDNTLKIKPPMVFSRDDVDLFSATLDEILTLAW